MTPLHAVRNVPVIPGWVTSLEDGELVAERFEDLTEYQLSKGVLDRVTAMDARELERLCIGQYLYGLVVTDAEAVRARAEVPAQM
jgi:hypothetical protein